MSRVFLLIMDSVGIGGALDAADFGDEGSDTIGHIARECAAGRVNIGREGSLKLPNLDRLGLGAVAQLATGRVPDGLTANTDACFGAANEISAGKDTPTGHWELAGVPLTFDWHYFPDTQPSFPADKIAEFIKRAKIPGVLGDRHASGMKIIADICNGNLRINPETHPPITLPIKMATEI